MELTHAIHENVEVAFAANFLVLRARLGNVAEEVAGVGEYRLLGRIDTTAPISFVNNIFVGHIIFQLMNHQQKSLTQTDRISKASV